MRRLLVVGQISVLMLLLIAAGLFVQTVTNLHAISLGFNQNNVLLFEVNAPHSSPEIRIAGFPSSSTTA